MPLLTAMRRTPKLSEEQQALREAWDTLSEKVLLVLYRAFSTLIRPSQLKIKVLTMLICPVNVFECAYVD